MTPRRRCTRAGLALAALLAVSQAGAQITFYENDDFRGRTFRTQQAVSDLLAYGFNDHASSVVVEGGRWEACDDSRFRGQLHQLQMSTAPGETIAVNARGQPRQ